MAPFSIFLYFQGPLQATLQALNLAKAAMMNSLFGAVIKTAAIFVLATRPELGIMGAALAIVIGMVLVTLLHFASIVKVLSFTLHVREVGKSLLAMIATGAVGMLLYEHAFLSMSLLVKTLLSLTIVGLFYGILLIVLGLIKREEIIRVPFIGKWLAPFTKA